ncbi:MAG: hypothetical protein NTX56_04440 [Proteobacteria bacterium]|nr:hypothetical protein [Pseudomonadota bacterium]
MLQDRFTRAIEREMEKLARSVMETPPQSYEAFRHRVGEYAGLKRAIGLFDSLADEIEKELNRG